MVWLLVIVVIIAIYNAERLPEIISKLKSEVPHLVDAGKKVSQEIKEKAHSVQAKTAQKKKKEQKQDEKSENN
jgi:Sec-independent protein translocase protein TatA